MKIPENVLEKWKELRSYGEGREIAQTHENITEDEISKAFNSGKCTDKVFKILATFYKNKEAQIQKLLQ